MDVKGRRDEYAELTRTAVVEAAIGRFASRGFTGTSIDAVAADARVTKGAVYHHFADKSALFEAVFVAMEERLLREVTSALIGVEDPWEVMAAGIGTFLDECCRDDFRRIALEEAPAALGWDRWRRIEERYFLGMVMAGLDGLARAGLIEQGNGELTARAFLGAASEVGLAVAAAGDPEPERARAAEILMRFLRALG